jgi:hypothetical protein
MYIIRRKCGDYLSQNAHYQNRDIAIHGGGNEAEDYSIERALGSGCIHKYAK